MFSNLPAAHHPDPDPLRPPHGADPADLRRRGVRAHADVILSRAAHIAPHDRALLEAVFRDHLSCADIALLRRAGETPRSVARRVRVLVQRVTSPTFGHVLRHARDWPATRRRVAAACVLQGLSARQAAPALGLTVYAVRRQLEVIRELAHERDA